MIKGILKRRSPDSVASGSSPGSGSDESPTRKRVSFDGAEPARVFEADEWDRSPAAITLKLTYKDFAELRDLNVCVVSSGPVLMERTPSRRPTRKRTPVPANQRTESLGSIFPSLKSSSKENILDRTVSHFSRLNISPNHQYQPFASQALAPLVEDVPSPSNTSPPERNGPDHPVSVSEESTPLSPPGLPIPSLQQKCLPSSPPTSPSPLSPMDQQLSMADEDSLPGVMVSQKHVVFPTLSWPGPVSVEFGKGILTPPSPTLKPGCLEETMNLPTSDLDVVQPRRGTLSLMGWDIYRSDGGKRGFGLVRRGTSA